MIPQNNYQPQSRDGLYFSITTVNVSGNKLGRAVKDKDGYFTDIPVAVLGIPTRNQTQYDTPEFLSQLRGPDTTFFRRVTEGTLFGEWGHPFVDLNSERGLARLMNLEPKNESNHIRSVTVKHADTLNLDLIYLDSKGSGPYGKYFDDAMTDPCRNIAFSLRGISRATKDRRTGITHRKLINLVTFDSGVASGGFAEASKRFMASTEDLSFQSEEILNKQITADNITIVRNIAMESFTDTDLNELMKASKVVIGSVEIGYVDTRTKTVIEQETGNRRGLFHSFMQVKR